MRICVVVGLCSDIFFIIFINTVCVGLVSLIVLFYFILFIILIGSWKVLVFKKS